MIPIPIRRPAARLPIVRHADSLGRGMPSALTRSVRRALPDCPDLRSSMATASSLGLGRTARRTLARPEATDVPVCRHCGDPCGDDALRTSHGAFCCGGCSAVFDVLSSHGLTGFYRCDLRPGVSQRAQAHRAADRFAVLDDPAVAGRFVRPLGGTTARAVLAVPALHCASCVWLLEQLWRVAPGVSRSEVDLVRRQVRVEFDAAQTSVRRIAEALASLGYEPLLDETRAAESPSNPRRTLYLKLGLAGFAFGNLMLFSIPRYANGGPLEPGFQRLFDLLNLALALPVLVYSAADWFRASLGALRARTVTLDVPIAIGLAALFGRSVFEVGTGTGEGFFDSFAGLVFFLLIGRLFQQKAFDAIAFDRTVRSFLPLSVRVERGDDLAAVPLDALEPGDVTVLRPHEVVPTDAVLLDGSGAVDYAFITGEQDPVFVQRGDVVRAGGRVRSHSVRLRALGPASASGLVDLWSHPVFARPKRHWLTDASARVGAWFTVAALGLAAAGALAWWPDAAMSLQVATAVLIVACPCALTLAAPITLGTAMGMLGRIGCFLKTPAVALDLARVNTVVFDKTGTLTVGGPAGGLRREGLDPDAWARAACLAAESLHPVSRALAAAARADGQLCHSGQVSNLWEVPGRGVSGVVDHVPVAIGSAAFVASESGRPIVDEPGVTWVAVEGRIGRLESVPAARTGLDASLGALADRHGLWLLSGDWSHGAAHWRRWFGMHRMSFRQSPDDKLAAIREHRAAGSRVLMVGDGLNDAGALAAADVGMAVSDDTACLVPACDVVIRGDRLSALPDVLRYVRRARAVVLLCLAVSLAYNVGGLTLALAGHLTPLTTAILMPVSSLTVIGLSVGLMRWRRPEAATA